MQLVFVHGWGFSSAIWDPIRDALPQYEHFTIDFGYLEKPPTPTKDLPLNAVYIGHSLGVQWLLCNAMDKMAGLVSISGFDCFSRHVQVQTINLMKQGLRKNPALQLSVFHKQCGLQKSRNYKSIHLDNLLAGLDTLSSQDCQPQKQQLSIPVSVLASRNDAIVTADITEKIWSGHNIFWNDNGGHILPIKHPQWCVNHIIKLVEQVASQKPDQYTP